MKVVLKLDHKSCIRYIKIFFRANPCGFTPYIHIVRVYHADPRMLTCVLTPFLPDGNKWEHFFSHLAFRVPASHTSFLFSSKYRYRHSVLITWMLFRADPRVLTWVWPSLLFLVRCRAVRAFLFYHLAFRVSSHVVRLVCYFPRSIGIVTMCLLRGYCFAQIHAC